MNWGLKSKSLVETVLRSLRVGQDDFDSDWGWEAAVETTLTRV